MIKKTSRNEARMARHARIRSKVSGTSELPRLCVFRSLKNISVQIIDDVKGVTLVSASTIEKELNKTLENKTRQEKAFVIGQTVANRAKEKGITTIVFDRGGYLFSGCVKQVADGAKDAGLEF